MKSLNCLKSGMFSVLSVPQIFPSPVEEKFLQLSIRSHSFNVVIVRLLLCSSPKCLSFGGSSFKWKSRRQSACGNLFPSLSVKCQLEENILVWR